MTEPIGRGAIEKQIDEALSLSMMIDKGNTDLVQEHNDRLAMRLMEAKRLLAAMPPSPVVEENKPAFEDFVKWARYLNEIVKQNPDSDSYQLAFFERALRDFDAEFKKTPSPVLTAARRVREAHRAYMHAMEHAENESAIEKAQDERLDALDALTSALEEVDRG